MEERQKKFKAIFAENPGYIYFSSFVPCSITNIKGLLYLCISPDNHNFLFKVRDPHEYSFHFWIYLFRYHLKICILQYQFLQHHQQRDLKISNNKGLTKLNKDLSPNCWMMFFFLNFLWKHTLIYRFSSMKIGYNIIQFDNDISRFFLIFFYSLSIFLYM